MWAARKTTSPGQPAWQPLPAIHVVHSNIYTAVQLYSCAVYCAMAGLSGFSARRARPRTGPPQPCWAFNKIKNSSPAAAIIDCLSACIRERRAHRNLTGPRENQVCEMIWRQTLQHLTLFSRTSDPDSPLRMRLGSSCFHLPSTISQLLAVHPLPNPSHMYST